MNLKGRETSQVTGTMDLKVAVCLGYEDDPGVLGFFVAF